MTVSFHSYMDVLFFNDQTKKIMFYKAKANEQLD